MPSEHQSNLLYVVRNGAVKVEPGAVLAEWRLSQAGVLLTIPIAEASFWSKAAIIYHGPEKSSEHTARIISRRWQLPLACEWDLRELLLAPWVNQGPLSGDGGAASQHWLEDGAEAELRIVRAVKRLATRHAGQSFAIVAQGRILTSLYSCLLGRALGPLEWQSLRSPDLSVIDLGTWQVKQGFFSQLQR